MSIEAELRAEFDRWERKENAVLGVLPYFLLAVSLLFALLQPIVGLPQVHYPATLGLTAVTVIWLMLAMVMKLELLTEVPVDVVGDPAVALPPTWPDTAITSPAMGDFSVAAARFACAW